MMRTLHIDVKEKPGKLDRYFAHCVGAGRAGEMMRAEVLQQLTQLQKTCGLWISALSRAVFR